jgi:hypothetical protein
MNKWIQLACLFGGISGFSISAIGDDLVNPCKPTDRPGGDCPLEWSYECCDWECLADDDHFCCEYTVNGEDYCELLIRQLYSYTAA